MADYLYYVEANIACVVILSTVLFTLEKGVDKQISTVLLIRMMRLLLIYFLTDSIWVLFECGVFASNKTILYIATIIPYLALLITSWLWYIYCEIVQQNSWIRTKLGTFISAIPFWIALIILVLGLFTSYLFIIEDDGSLSYGPLYGALLMGPFGYLLYSSVKAFIRAYTRNRYVDHKLYIAMGLFPLLPITCGLLQSFYLTVPIMCYGATCAILFQYLMATDNRISTDPLTRLNNRQELQRYLTLKMKSRPQGKELYLMIFDVDHFKEINDKYGHIEGDSALVKMADAMRETCVDAADKSFLARFGGDEFIAIVEADNEQQVMDRANQIRSNITRLNEESGAEYKLEACVGYARYDYDNPMTIPQFIAKADEKLYEMKKNR